MFSGIVEEVGEILARRDYSDRSRFKVSTSFLSEETEIGDSIAVNGVCLTVVGRMEDSLDFDVSSHTLSSTNLGLTRRSLRVNLERSLKAGGRISGHFVTGHIDCMGTISSLVNKGQTSLLYVSVPSRYRVYLVEKGSVAVEGISLTVAGLTSGGFSSYIIPHTLKSTNLKEKRPSSKLNIEFDILIKGLGRVKDFNL